MKDKFKGKALADLLLLRIRVEGVSLDKVARQLGISQGYLSQLLCGDKRFASASESVLRECAGFLKIPSVICFCLAGKLRVEDFFEQPDMNEERVQQSLLEIAKSQFGLDVAVTLNELVGVPIAVKYLLIRLFEVATEKELLSGRVRWKSIHGATCKRMPFELRFVKQK